MSDALEMREARDEDLPVILQLLRDSMGRAEDDRFELLFRWKHLENAFGRSPMWVACDGDRIVGLRTLMRWEFERAGAIFRCVRAVDTATHPKYQGRGIFSRLTLAALPVLEAEGVDFVFNTPNDQSRPGYLKMGWQTVGRAPARVRPRSIGAAITLARNRVAAAHWSEPSDFGVPVEDLLAESALDELLRAPDGPDRLTTRRTVAYLRWRYATPPLQYRAIVAGGGAGEGAAIVRIRRRGHAREAVVAVLLAPGRTERTRLMRDVRRTVGTRADYLIGVGTLPRAIPLPSLGPVVTTRDVSSPAPKSIAEFALSLGDIEVF
jgi:GNAT superfamily N-acetyltransferase